MYKNCSECQNKTKTTICICSAGIMSLQFSLTMNSLSSYCGLVDAKIRASDKDLPVQCRVKLVQFRSIGIILTTESFADGSSEVGRA